MNPLVDIINEREFKARYRFTPENVAKIIDMVKPYLNIGQSNRGLPCTAEQIVCNGLEILAAGQFFRVAGYSSGVCTATAWNNLYR